MLFLNAMIIAIMHYSGNEVGILVFSCVLFGEIYGFYGKIAISLTLLPNDIDLLDGFLLLLIIYMGENKEFHFRLFLDEVFKVMV